MKYIYQHLKIKGANNGLLGNINQIERKRGGGDKSTKSVCLNFQCLPVQIANLGQKKKHACYSVYFIKNTIKAL